MVPNQYRYRLSLLLIHIRLAGHPLWEKSKLPWPTQTVWWTQLVPCYSIQKMNCPSIICNTVNSARIGASWTPATVELMMIHRKLKYYMLLPCWYLWARNFVVLRGLLGNRSKGNPVAVVGWRRRVLSYLLYDNHLFRTLEVSCFLSSVSDPAQDPCGYVLEWLH